MKLILTEAALDDLRSIRSDPFRFRLRPELFPGCHVTSEGRHVLLFRAAEGSLEMVRVLHSAMDFRRHLPPEEI